MKMTLKTNGDINRLGDKIRDEYPNIKNSTKEQIQEHRISFKETTNATFNSLCSLSKRVNKNAIITYRIKRIETIIGKLKRLNTDPKKKQLFARMWDISGCRCIVDNDREVYKLEKLISKKFTVRKRTDYIKKPKPNGYKSLHLYLQLPNDSKVVEVQLRNRIDHNWATLVEITDVIFDSQLKEYGKNKKLERFLFLLSKRKSLVFKDKIFIASVLKEYKYFENLSKVFTRNYLKVRNRWLDLEMKYNHKFFLIETKKDEIPKINSFDGFNKAEDEYFKRYLTNHNSNIVLTHLTKPSYKNISSAYSNYILTVHSVLDDITIILRELIIECIKEKKYFLFLKYYNLHLSILYNHINNLNSEILVSKSIGMNNKIKQNEWKADIRRQREKIEKNEKKLYLEANKYKIESRIVKIFLTYRLKRIMKRNRKKIKKY
ncbi:RelA/SpoT domain-containing protein [Tenacibaculum ascidiaceicola]|uniref:RelA/SpoT domain-containing protein n=1 Tax=Tenacibaculum ascidiaceicola TaxID=1699411 RepID=UPI0039E60ACC